MGNNGFFIVAGMAWVICLVVCGWGLGIAFSAEINGTNTSGVNRFFHQYSCVSQGAGGCAHAASKTN